MAFRMTGRMSGPRHALRTLRREWRLPELRTLIGALLLSVVVLGAVATLAARVQRAVVMSAAELIGGDLGINAAAPLPAGFVRHAQALNLRTSALAEFPSVAFANERSQLLQVVAADAAWPLRGKLVIAGGGGGERSMHAPPAGSVYLDHRALVALDLQPGQRVQVGGMRLVVAGQIVQQPGGGDLVALAPRAVMALADAQSAGLLGTGSRARHRLLVAGTVAPVDAYRAWAKARLPADARLQTVGGPGKEAWVDGRNYPWDETARKRPQRELAAWRLEVAPGAPRLRDDFLHVLFVDDATAPAVSAGFHRAVADVGVEHRFVVHPDTGGDPYVTSQEAVVIGLTTLVERLREGLG